MAWKHFTPTDCAFFLLFLITRLGRDPSIDLLVASKVTPLPQEWGSRTKGFADSGLKRKK